MCTCNRTFIHASVLLPALSAHACKHAAVCTRLGWLAAAQLIDNAVEATKAYTHPLVTLRLRDELIDGVMQKVWGRACGA